MDLNTIQTVNVEQEKLKQLILTNKVSDQNLTFSIGLVKARKPSPSQMYWVGKMIEDATSQSVASKTAANPAWKPEPIIKIDVTNIVSMFANAKKHLKFPKVTLLMDINRLDSGVRFSFDRKGRNTLWANEQISYGVTFASINLDTGVVDLRRHGQKVKPQFLKLLEDFSKAPVQMAIMHGKLTGNCCFCSLPLTDERSLQCGYGDTCARHYRLPWGKNNNMTAIGDWALNGSKPDAPKTYYAHDHGELRRYVSRENESAKLYRLPVMDADHLTEVNLRTLREQIEANLSPENLSCDGELSNDEILKRERYLKDILVELDHLDRC